MFIRFARKVYDKLLEKFKITFTGIETEIKKDDDIDISNLKDIAPAIEQLKNSRKRWASGEAVPEFITDGSLGFVVIKPKLRFIAKNVFIKVIYDKNNVKMTYDIQPFDVENNSYSSVCLMDNSLTSSNSAKAFKMDDRTFVEFRRNGGSSYGENVRDLQLTLSSNEFVVSHGYKEDVKNIVANNKIKITYIAFE